MTIFHGTEVLVKMSIFYLIFIPCTNRSNLLFVACVYKKNFANDLIMKIKNRHDMQRIKYVCYFCLHYLKIDAR